MSILHTTVVQSLYIINNGQIKTDQQILLMFLENDSLLFDFIKENTATQIFTAVTKVLKIPAMAHQALEALTEGLHSSLSELVQNDDFIDSHTEEETMDDYSNLVYDAIDKLEHLNNILINTYA